MRKGSKKGGDVEDGEGQKKGLNLGYSKAFQPYLGFCDYMHRWIFSRETIKFLISSIKCGVFEHPLVMANHFVKLKISWWRAW